MRTVFQQTILRKHEWLWLIVIALVTAISSEIKISPFNGEHFRFGLGSIMFLLLLLLRTPKNIVWTGFVTGLVVVGFRVTIESIFTANDFQQALLTNLPALMYYVLYAIGFVIFQLERLTANPFTLGIVATFMEFVANGVEHLARNMLIDGTTLHINDWLILLAVAIIRSFFVVGVYASVMSATQQRRLTDELYKGSHLYMETLYLQKSMDNIEKIMADSFDLYRQLKHNGDVEMSKRALHISQEIHEVKKDSQRIYSGLSKMTTPEETKSHTLESLFAHVELANKQYAELIHRDVTIIVALHTNFTTKEQIPLLAIINNLIANAIESIEKTGTVKITVNEAAGVTTFIIEDDGVGIIEEDMTVIFEPGFTTKYNQEGVAATGIGLSHVREVVHRLEGVIQCKALAQGTQFNVLIPTKNIRK